MSSRAAETYKQLKAKIAEHGTEVVTEEDLSWYGGRSLTQSRTLIVLEMLYQKAVHEGDKGAAQQFLDRTLGKPKESLNLTDESGVFGKLSDDELAERITTIIKSAQKAGA